MKVSLSFNVVFVLALLFQGVTVGTIVTACLVSIGATLGLALFLLAAFAVITSARGR